MIISECRQCHEDSRPLVKTAADEKTINFILLTVVDEKHSAYGFYQQMLLFYIFKKTRQTPEHGCDGKCGPQANVMTQPE